MNTGLDLGFTATSLVTLDDGYNIIHRYTFGTSTPSLARLLHSHPFVRLKAYSEHFRNYLSRGITGTLVMECPMGAHAGNGAKTNELYSVYGLAAMEYFSPAKIFTPRPPTIKKFFAGHGFADKAKMIKTAVDLGYEVIKTSHEADALAMALMGGKYKFTSYNK